MQINKVSLNTNNNNNSQSRPAFKMQLESTGSTLGYLKSLKVIADDYSSLEREVVEHAKDLKPDTGAFWWLSFNRKGGTIDGVKLNLTQRKVDYKPGDSQLTATNENWIPYAEGKTSLSQMKTAFLEVIDKLSAKSN